MTSRRALFLDHVAGIAGDMFSAAFVDAGLIDAKILQRIPTLLGLKSVKVRVERSIRASIRGTHISVEWDRKAKDWQMLLGGGKGHTQRGEGKRRQTHSHSAHSSAVPHRHGSATPHRHSHGQSYGYEVGREGIAGEWHTHYLQLDQVLAASKLKPAVIETARRIFRNLAEAEADSHGISLEQVVFHEVGAIDSVIDVLMAATCIIHVHADVVFSTPVKLGRGLVKMAHGTQPVPPPACARLAVGMPVAAVPAGIEAPNIELSTPTGLAIVKSLGPKFVDGVPAGRVIGQGMGTGTKDLGNYPNGIRVFLLEQADTVAHIDGSSASGENAGFAEKLPYESDRIIEVACTIDDDTGEHLSWLASQCLKQGALDVWMAPATGKKSRPAVIFTALVQAEEQAFERIARLILTHGTTLGLRYRSWDRLKLVREFETRECAGSRVRFKLGRDTTGKLLKAKAEYEDLAKLWDAEVGLDDESPGTEDAARVRGKRSGGKRKTPTGGR